MVAESVMPVPAPPEDESVTSTVLALFRQLHAQLREEIIGLDATAINWVPTAGANSIATIVTHLVGSEAETIRCVAGQPCDRDREAEFQGRERVPGGLLGLLESADDLIEALEPRLDADRLKSVLALPTLPADEVRSGLTWLVGNYGHAREHLGHLQLTKQLYQGQTSPGL